MTKIYSTTANDIRNAVLNISDISPHPRNYNTHSEAQLKQLEASDARFGQVRSIVVQEGAPGRYLLVAGHGYLEARKRRGMLTIRADIIPASWSAIQVEGYLVADNMLAHHSNADEQILAQLLQEQQDNGFDLLTLGTDEALLHEMLARIDDPQQFSDDSYGDEEKQEPDEDEDEDEEKDGSLLDLMNVTIAEPIHVVHRGETWHIGKHILLCMDVFFDWKKWNIYLDSEDSVFAPFPGPLVILTKKAEAHKMVMVQPDPYVAGHILDQYVAVHGQNGVYADD